MILRIAREKVGHRQGPINAKAQPRAGLLHLRPGSGPASRDRAIDRAKCTRDRALSDKRPTSKEVGRLHLRPRKWGRKNGDVPI